MPDGAGGRAQFAVCDLAPPDQRALQAVLELAGAFADVEQAAGLGRQRPRGPQRVAELFALAEQVLGRGESAAQAVVAHRTHRVGVRVDENPISFEKVFAALQAKAEGKEARFGPANDETGVPQVDFGESLQIKTPWQGGDGTAHNDPHRTKKAKK